MVIKEVLRLYPAWKPSEPESYQAFEDALVLLVQMRGQQSAAIAARYYALFHEAETGAAMTTAVAMAGVADEAVVRAAIGTTARGGLYEALRAGQPFEQARKTAFVQVSGAVSKQVSDTGRYTIIQAVDSDKEALGWCRVTGGDPCAWCAMLASRGPVYKGDADSIEIWDHEHGDCSAEPAYAGYQWPAKNKELHDEWNEAKGSKDKGADAFTNWRQFYEGRGKYAPEE